MEKGDRNAIGTVYECTSLWIVRSNHWRGDPLDLAATEKEEVMLFVQIVVSVILAVLMAVFYFSVIKGEKTAEIRQNQITVMVGNLVKNVYRDTYSFVTEYHLAKAPQGKKAPTVVFKRYFDGNEDIQFGSTAGQAEMENYGKYKRALLEEALKDINGQVVNKIA